MEYGELKLDRSHDRLVVLRQRPLTKDFNAIFET